MSSLADRARSAAGVAVRSARKVVSRPGSPPDAPPVAEPATTMDDPDAWWSLLPFTAHNIELAPGVWTRPGTLPAIDDARTAEVVASAGGSLAGRSIVDLGCLEGGFTLAFAELGADAIGIEARPLNVRRCELARALTRQERARFIAGDVKAELPKLGRHDVVFVAGLLYHVADPLELLADVCRATGEFALIDTHVAGEAAPSHGCSDLVERTFRGESYRGRDYPEYPSDIGVDEHEGLLWAAWSDADAFWPLERDLVRMFAAAGFTESRAVTAAGPQPWGVDPVNRVMYVCRR